VATIKKPDANPVVALLLSLIWGLGHVVINGQQRKWLFILLAWFIGFILCVFPSVIVTIFSLIDAYQTAERLQKGEEIPENEYSFPLLYKVISIIDKTATCSKA